MDYALFGADHGPAAFRLHLAHLGVGLGPVEAHAAAMGHLIEAVLRRYGTDLDRFEENIVSGIAGHHSLRRIIVGVGGRLGEAVDRV